LPLRRVASVAASQRCIVGCRYRYGAELAAAVEDKAEQLCTDDAMARRVCTLRERVPFGDDPARPHSALVHGAPSARVDYKAFNPRKYDRAACDARVRAGCRDLHAEEIETLIGLVLDGDGSELCTALVKDCDEPHAQLFNFSWGSYAEMVEVAGQGAEVRAPKAQKKAQTVEMPRPIGKSELWAPSDERCTSSFGQLKCVPRTREPRTGRRAKGERRF